MVMAMEDKQILLDCLETLKHLGMNYQMAAFECDSDQIRKAFENIQIDKDELRNAVFNLMHQSGYYKTQPADVNQVATQTQTWQQTLGGMQKQKASASQKEDPGKRQYT
jgi:spore coat protein CotF